jgi:hypothetical protein
MKNSTDKLTQRLAVLIDAENAQAAVIKPIFEYIARFGTVAVKRIYGDFSSSSRTSKSWRNSIQEHAIKTIHQYAFSSGKNSSDSALIIDAMDLLHAKNLDGICLITSDSDFTGLAIRFKEEGVMTYGFGEDKTPVAFRNACDEFILTEGLRGTCTKTPDVQTVELEKTANIENISKQRLPVERLLKLLKGSLGKDGWIYLAAFGNHLHAALPEFDCKEYGFRNLSELVKERTDLFITEDKPNSGGRAPSLYMRACY